MEGVGEDSYSSTCLGLFYRGLDELDYSLIKASILLPLILRSPPHYVYVIAGCFASSLTCPMNSDDSAKGVKGLSSV